MNNLLNYKKRSFLTNAAIYGIGGILMQVAGFILLPIYTHKLTPSEYGIIDIIERISNIMNICLMAGGLRQATLAFYLQSNDEREQLTIAPSIIVFIIGIYISVVIISIVLGPYIADWMGIEDTRILVFGIITVMAELFLLVPLVLMQARVESLMFVIISFLMLLVRVSLAVLFLVYFGWGVWGVYSALFITYVGFGITLTLRELRKGFISINWATFRSIAKFSMPFIPTGIFMFLIYNADRFFLLNNKGKVAVGIYALGCKLASVVGLIISQPMFKVWTAHMYDVFKTPEAAIVAGHMLSRILVAYALVGVGLCLFYQEVLSILSDPVYASAGNIIPILVFANAFVFASNYMECVFYVFRRTHLKPFTSGAGAIIILVLYAILIPRFGINGAAYATLFGYISVALVTYIVSRRVFGVHYEIFKILSIIVLSVGTVYASHRLTSQFYFFKKATLLFIWIVIIWFSGIISHKDKKNVKRIVSNIKLQLKSSIWLSKSV